MLLHCIVVCIRIIIPWARRLYPPVTIFSPREQCSAVPNSSISLSPPALSTFCTAIGEEGGREGGGREGGGEGGRGEGRLANYYKL